MMKYKWLYASLFLCFSCFAVASDEGFDFSLYMATTNSFSFSWKKPYEFNNCTMYVWQEKTIPGSSGEIIWNESFSNAVSSTSTTALKERDIALYTDTFSGGEGWSYERLYRSMEDGTLRLGNTSDSGWLLLPSFNLSGTSRAIKIRAKKMASKDGDLMPIDFISGSETNTLDVLCLTDDYDNYIISIDDDCEIERLLIHSATNKTYSRTIIDSIEFVKDWRSDSTIIETNEVRQIINDGYVVISNCESKKVFVQFNSDADSINLISPILEVDFNNIGKSLSVSEFSNYKWVEDFNFVTNVTQATLWENGRTVRGFYAYQNSEEITQLRYDSKISTLSGIFASSTNTLAGAYSLSMRPSGEKEVVLELRILNDTDLELDEIVVSYDLYEWVNKNAKENPEIIETYAVSKNPFLPPTSWLNVNGGIITNETGIEKTEENLLNYGFSREKRRITLPVSIAPNDMFYYRWTVPSKRNAAMAGVGSLEIITQKKSLGFRVIIK